MTSTDSATTRETNKQTLRRAMDGISRLDGDAVIAELDDTGVFALPFEAAVPDCDRAGFLQLLSIMFTMFKTFDVTITDIFDLVDPNILVARYHNDAEGRDRPISYRNEYIGLFHFRDGKILSWREYADPDVTRAVIAQFAEPEPGLSV
jgi:ketosteroid isomerase-like protein